MIQPLEDGGLAPNDEVDELRWVTLGDAARLLTYAPRRRPARPRAIDPRPAAARIGGRPAQLGGDDMLRPLDRRRRAQSLALRDALLGRGVTRVLSSPYVRCTETVAPLAASLGVAVELDDRLAEGAGGAGARELLAARDGCVACTRGDIVEELIGRTLKKGAAVVLELRGSDLCVLERLKAPLTSGGRGRQGRTLTRPQAR